MDSLADKRDEVVFDSSTICIYRSGKMDRLYRPERAPTGLDPATGVTSKDGGFLIESVVPLLYHDYVASLAAAARVLAVSVQYRLAPERPVPAAYDDAWADDAQDAWLAEHGDTTHLFLAGDSAGGNMVHNVLMTASFEPATRVEGAILLHPWFGGNTVVNGEPEAMARGMAVIWECACPGAVGGADDLRINPMVPGAPGLENLQCEHMLVCAGEQDWVAARNRAYYAAVSTSAWRGSVWRGGVAWVESEGEGHVVFLEKPDCTKARELMDRVVGFIAGQ